jgi:hypothetical protein
MFRAFIGGQAYRCGAPQPLAPPLRGRIDVVWARAQANSSCHSPYITLIVLAICHGLRLQVHKQDIPRAYLSGDHPGPVHSLAYAGLNNANLLSYPFTAHQRWGSFF